MEHDLFPLLWRDQRAWVRHHFSPVLSAHLDLRYAPVLIHGDLAQYHILYDVNSGISGVLDFGTAGLGDPAGDFSVVISMYRERFLHRMVRTYPAILGALDRARFWALGDLHGMQQIGLDPVALCSSKSSPGGPSLLGDRGLYFEQELRVAIVPSVPTAFRLQADRGNQELPVCTGEVQVRRRSLHSPLSRSADGWSNARLDLHPGW